MKVSVCVTTFNELKEDIQKLLDALNKQTLKPNEIILVDASTKEITNNQASIIKQFPNTKYKILKGTSRARGRNEAIKLAKNEIIAVTDVGCVPRKDWLENITKPFKIASSQAPRNDTKEPRNDTKEPRNDTIVAGFYSMVPTMMPSSAYSMVYKNNLQKAMRVFLGVLPKNFDNNFMPSARSMAFTKTIWKKAGGFPENLKNTAEDTLFNVNLIKAGATFIRVKNAVVEWGTPKSIYEFGFKIYEYAKGDAGSGIWWHPVKGIQSHNIKILSIYLRYAVGIWLLVVSKPLFFLYAITYSLYAICKAGLWGLALQPVSDFAVMIGFLKGLLMR